MKNQKGFALVEMIVVVAVLGVVTAASAGYYHAVKIRDAKRALRPVPPATAQMKTVAVRLNPQNGSSRSGMAVLTEISGKVRLVTSLSGSSEGVSRPAHIHVGACPNVGAVKYPLANLVNGTSQTTLDVSLADLLKQLPLAINVHKSTDEPSVYLACGNLVPLAIPSVSPGPR